MRRFGLALVAVCLSMGAANAQAAAVRVLSGGAVQPALEALAQTYQARTGDTLAVTYATAPELLSRVSGGETSDILIAPVDVVDKLVAAGKVLGPPVVLGAVGVSVLVRHGAAHPDVATVEALKRSILAAKSVVYNRGSTGEHMEAVVSKLGVGDQIAGRSVRPISADEVMKRLQAGTGDEIGFAATTVIQLAIDRGARLDIVGPLPAALQNETTYSAVRFPVAGAQASGFYALLTGPEGKATMAAKGVR